MQSNLYLSRVGTKHEVGHGLPCGLPYGLPVVKIVKKHKQNISKSRMSKVA